MKDISIWLVPRKDQRDNLQKIVDELSSRHKSFSFIPHITVYHLSPTDGYSSVSNEVIAIAKDVSENLKPITLSLETFSHSDEFTKTIFAKYSISSDLKILYNKFKIELYSKYPYELNPHLSLIYKNNMTTFDKEKEVAHVKVPKKLVLDTISIIVKEGGPIGQEKDVLDWKVMFEALLSNNV
jgi:hypothetical protein